MNGQTLREQDLKPNNRTPAQDLVDQVDPILDMAKPEQQNQTLKFGFLKAFVSFDTLFVSGSANVVEIEIISRIVSFKMILRSNIPVCTFHC